MTVAPAPAATDETAPNRRRSRRTLLAALGMAPVLAAAGIAAAPAAGAAPAAPATHSAAAARTAPKLQAQPVELALPAPFSGTFTLTNFSHSGRTLIANGVVTVRNATTGQTATQNASVPVARSNAAAPAAAPNAVAAPAAVTCNVLNLVLGPLHLNLLGLVIDLNQVVLNITAVQGGGLLGDLLCGLANSPLGAGLANLLNRLLGAL